MCNLEVMPLKGRGMLSPGPSRWLEYGHMGSHLEAGEWGNPRTTATRERKPGSWQLHCQGHCPAQTYSFWPFLTNTVVSPGSIVMVSMLVSVTRPWTPYEDLSPYSQFRTVAPELLWGPCECLWNECMNEWRFCDIYQLVMEVVTDASEMWRKRHLPFEMYV